MEMGYIFDFLVALIIIFGGWYFSQINKRIERNEERLADTREKFIHKDEMSKIMDRIDGRIAKPVILLTVDSIIPLYTRGS